MGAQSARPAAARQGFSLAKGTSGAHNSILLPSGSMIQVRRFSSSLALKKIPPISCHSFRGFLCSGWPMMILAPTEIGASYQRLELYVK